MKTTNYLLFFILALGLNVSIMSCKDDEDPLTKREILSAKSWRLISEKVNGVENILDCEKDDLITFAPNGQYFLNPNTITCFPDEPIEGGTWDLSADEKTLIINGGNLNIVELTETKLIVSGVLGNETFVLELTSL